MREFTADLIREAATGSQSAITELYEKTYSSIYKTVKSMIADEDTVLDILQDSYIKGFQSLNQLDAPENFRAWMKRIATNKAKDHLKKKKPILFTDMAGEDGEEIDFRDECLEHCPEEVLDRKETARLMQEILATLSEDQRLVIGMFYYEEMSVREIAEILGCSENTVKSRLNYGRKKIEVQVRELEKKGTKLYSLAPVAFLLWLFRMDAKAAEIPSSLVLESVTVQCGAAGTAAAGAATAAGAGMKAAAGMGFKAIATKIVAGVLAATVVGGGAMAAITALDRDEEAQTSHHHSRDDREDEEAQLREEQIPEQEEKEGTTIAAATETVSSGEAEAAYRVILDAYQEVMNMDSQVFLDSPESYFHGDHVIVRYHHMYQDGDFWYAYYDIDGNGVEELLIGYAPREYPEYVDIVDLYTLEGNEAVELMDEPTLGDRSSLTILSDGTLYFYGASSATEATHAYLRIHECVLVDAPASTAEEVTAFSWQIFEKPEEPVSQVSFDAIVTDIQQALTVSPEAYDADVEAYDAIYSHLGDGVMWMLTHRESGVYTLGIWNTEMDVDGDGITELCIGRGVSPSRVEPIVIYRRDGGIIFGDALYAYTDLFYGDTAVEWNYLGG